ncbi:elongation factor P [Benincasa hispida]|uniref:elongation factor P n=1 Tax=Benincasa hispida TaxID=102211 RepID=UPI00190297E6|nr:elongation factor P [Benincasa hispida]
MIRALLLRKGISRALSPPSSNNFSSFSSSSSVSDLLSSARARHVVDGDRHLLCSLWSVIQHRGFKVQGSDVRVGNIIERKERIFQVTKVEHSHEGRGKATIKVELRDVESGNKVTQRLATDESVDRVFVQEKAYIFMCRDRDAKVLLMDPDTFEQLEVPEELFGKAAMYLQDDMKVMVQLFNDTPLSASVPKRVTCVVKEAQPPMKGIAATPKEKKALLDNGMTIKVPPHVVVGDVVVINTEDDSYIERAKG